MKLYTKSGDDGTTGLFSGQRVGKDHPRVEAYGTVDELNAGIGMVAAICDESDAFGRQLLAIFSELQSRLFDIGADLATPDEGKHADRIARLSDAQVAQIEQWIDDIESGNEPLSQFILPGGTELAARLHLTRTICRRAERAIVHARHFETISNNVLKYLNRLGDLLFAMARRANKEAGVEDVPWQKT